LVTSGGELENPVSIVFGSDGLFVADPGAGGGTGAVINVDPETGSQTVEKTGAPFVDPSGVSVSSTSPSSLLVADPSAAPPAISGWGDGNVFALPSSASIATADTRPPSTPFVDPRDVVGQTVVDPAAGPEGSGALFTFQPGASARPGPFPPSVSVVTGGGMVEPVALTPLGGPGTNHAIAIADADAAGGGGALLRYGDPPQILVSGGSLVEPTGLSADLGRNLVLVADRDAGGGSGALIRVDLSTATQSVVASGAPFTDPADVAVDLPVCAGRFATHLGTADDDVLRGTAGDVIVALGGNDTIELERGAYACAGDGDDSVSVDGGIATAASTAAIGEAGTDSLLLAPGTSGAGVSLAGGDGANTIRGDAATLLGGPDADSITGGASDQTITGGGGADVIAAGGGDDYILTAGGLTGDLAGDVADAGEGDDTLFGSSGADRLIVADGRDSLSAGLGSDRLSGGRGPDSLTGGPGADTMKGGAGRDRCDGGSGRDRQRSCERNLTG
ncbi:MAG: calcium-binding protein, partial [Solirubrobacterales bacterium]